MATVLPSAAPSSRLPNTEPQPQRSGLYQMVLLLPWGSLPSGPRRLGGEGFPGSGTAQAWQVIEVQMRPRGLCQPKPFGS